MEKLDLYSIDLRGMTQDVSSYGFELGNDFFESIDAPEIRQGNLHVQLTVKKGIASFTLCFHTAGEVIVPCDRCLDDMTIPVDTTDSLKVRMGAVFSDEEEFVVIPEDEGCINVAWFIYEFVTLALPIQHVHEPGQCNKEMMKTLRQHLCVEQDEDMEDEIDYDDAEAMDEMDPRWSELKKILNNN